ncbi:hypothetical protein RJT34_32810 [Clitoria ternatea]|uniref:Uncharacterized protein n=1 Tax=Clitoria ternatea TaxID=43366 RepID=A0AAN9I4X8_CLITE
MAEWSKAPDSSSGSRERAWVQIPLLTIFQSFCCILTKDGRRMLRLIPRNHLKKQNQQHNKARIISF